MCDSSTVHPLPDQISFAQGACIGVPCATAYRALFLRCKARERCPSKRRSWDLAAEELLGKGAHDEKAGEIISKFMRAFDDS